MLFLFNQDAGGAKRAAADGPVFMTGRGRPAHGLPGMEDDRRLAGEPRSLADALSLPGLSEIDLDPPHARTLPREADLF